MKKQESFQGIVSLLVAIFAWSGSYFIAKEALLTVNTIYLSLFRYASASIILLILLGIIEGKKSYKLDNKASLLFFRSGVCFAIYSTISFIGLTLSSSIHAAIIMASMPMMIVFINWMSKGMKPTAITLGCMFIAAVGLFLALNNGNFHAVLFNR
jgi:drug/metabolite transporter (DMT)-like permease